MKISMSAVSTITIAHNTPTVDPNSDSDILRLVLMLINVELIVVVPVVIVGLVGLVIGPVVTVGVGLTIGPVVVD